MSSKVERKEKRESTVVTAIKTIYNFSQLTLWGLVLSLTLNGVVNGELRPLKVPNLYHYLTIAQFTQAIDILFSIIRFIPSSPVTSIIQIGARLLAVVFVFPNAVESSYVLIALLAWCSAELVRYGNYINDSLGLGLSFFKILRYNGFLLFYPAGGLGEFLSCYAAKETILAKNPNAPFSVNGVNLGVPLVQFYNLFLALILPGIIQNIILTLKGVGMMIFYMLGQRKRFYRKLKEEKSKSQ